MYKKVLLKLSGEALAAEDFPYSLDVIHDVARQVNEIVKQGCKVAIVVGGGNICRGRIFEELGFDRVSSDYTGMVATTLNASILGQAIGQTGIPYKVLSAVHVENVDMYDVELANKLMDEGYVLVFGGGVGLPYHSTDTGSAQRALDIHAEVILMAKSGCDGVYDKDPNKYVDAQKFDSITFHEIVEKDLKVIDLQAAKLCEKGKIEAFVFNMSDKDNIIKAVNKEAIGTVIKF